MVSDGHLYVMKPTHMCSVNTIDTYTRRRMAQCIPEKCSARKLIHELCKRRSHSTCCMRMLHGRENTGNVKGVEGRVFSKGKVGKV